MGIHSLRQYQVKQGDSVEFIAKLIFGSASRWKEIVELNRLDYPYIDTTPGASIPATKTIAILGSRLLIALLPGDSVVDDVFVDTERHKDIYEILFGSDIALTEDGDIAIDNSRSDFAIASGGKNLGQALLMKLKSFMGELVYHPNYGTTLHDLIGERLDIISASKANLEVRRTIYTDPRVGVIKELKVQSAGEPEIRVTTTISAIGAEGNTPLNLIIPKRGI
jgi:phage baseplate assembly protein W